MTTEFKKKPETARAYCERPTAKNSTAQDSSILGGMKYSGESLENAYRVNERRRRKDFDAGRRDERNQYGPWGLSARRGKSFSEGQGSRTSETAIRSGRQSGKTAFFRGTSKKKSSKVVGQITYDIQR